MSHNLGNKEEIILLEKETEYSLISNTCQNRFWMTEWNFVFVAKHMSLD